MQGKTKHTHNMTQLVSGPLDLPLFSVPVPPLHRPPGRPSAVPSSWKAKPTRRGATSAAWSARRRSWSKRPRPPSAWLRRLRRQPVSTLGWGWDGGAGGWEDVFRKIKRCVLVSLLDYNIRLGKKTMNEKNLRKTMMHEEWRGDRIIYWGIFWGGEIKMGVSPRTFF